jgi:hypothetical protein
MSVIVPDKPLIDTLPTPAAVRERLGDTLREVELLRRLLRLVRAAEQYRDADRARGEREKDVRHAG